MIDTGLFYECYGMENFLPKKILQFCVGNMTRNIYSPVKDSGIIHRGCTKAETGTVTKDSSNNAPIFTQEKKIVSTSDQSNGFSAH
jgi:hypothetical protein